MYQYKGGLISMDQNQLLELKESYYEYIATVSQGLQNIVSFLSHNELEKTFAGIANLAEGLEFLLKVEDVFGQEGMTINSRLNESITIFGEINNSLVNEDYLLLKDLIEYELIPLFSTASEWIFINKGE